jgi:hypothetical protein
MRTPRDLVQRLYRTKRAAAQLRAKFELAGCADADEALHTLKKLAAQEASVATLQWMLETDGAPEHPPQVGGYAGAWPKAVTVERIDVAPRPPHFPESLTVYLLRVPGDDHLGQQAWAAFLSPRQVAELREALTQLQRTRMGLVVASEPDEPQGA